jgi:hypothetical protein
MKPNPNCAEHVKFAAKGVLTRLALMFDAEPRKRWTGKQVTEVLLRVVTLIEHGTEDVEFTGGLQINHGPAKALSGDASQDERGA